MEIIKEIRSIPELTKTERDEILGVIAPYYIDATSVVERELAHNDTIYQLKDADHRLLAFFMVNWEQHLVGSEVKDVVYLGLSCTNPRYNEQKLASKMYYYFNSDAAEYERKTGAPLIMYGTTATPLVLLALPKAWDNIQPGLDGSYSAYDAMVIESIKKSMGYDRYSGDHPFVLKGVAHNTKYAPEEDERLKRSIEKYDIRLFEKLGIDENAGDRLLITCTTPGKDKMEEIRVKLFG